MKVKFLNYLLEAVLQAMLAVCTEIKFERKTFKLLIGGSTASNACSMQGYKNEKGESVRKDAKFDKQYLEGKYGADPYLRRIVDWGNV